MKEIRAFIKPHKLSDVTLALRKIEGLTGMTVTDSRGFGRPRAQDDNTAEEPSGYSAVARIEIICPYNRVDDIVLGIQVAAHTGLRGDGKIYVMPVEDARRISSGERGDTAV